MLLVLNNFIKIDLIQTRFIRDFDSDPEMDPDIRTYQDRGQCQKYWMCSFDVNRPITV